MVKNVKNNTFMEEVMSSETLVLVDFYTVWCGPCKKLSPVLENIAEKYEGKIKVVKVDVEEEVSLATLFRIASVPTVMFFKSGKAVGSFVGYKSEQEIETLIEKRL